MSQETPQNQLLLEIDSRQDEVLRQLDELIVRSERAVNENTESVSEPERAEESV